MLFRVYGFKKLPRHWQIVAKAMYTRRNLQRDFVRWDIEAMVVRWRNGDTGFYEASLS